MLTAKLAGDLFIYSYRRILRRPALRLSAILPMLSLLGGLAMLAAVAGHGGAQQLRYNPHLHYTHQLRVRAAQLVLENENAMLVLADPRTHRHFRVLMGLEDPAPYRRALLCDPAPLQGGGFDAIVFIDKPLSAFLSRAYGEPNCGEELQTLAAARGFTVIADDGRRYLAVSPGLQ